MSETDEAVRYATGAAVRSDTQVSRTPLGKAIAQLIANCGGDPDSEGMRNTPSRFVNAMREMTCGYDVDIAALMGAQFDAEGYDQMILVPGIDFYSLCEHHMLPFFGKAHVAYIPEKKLLGLSKFSRLVDAYAQRFQVQERLTKQIGETLDIYLAPLGSAVVVRAIHLCACARGVAKVNSTFETSRLAGAFRAADVRAELFALLSR